MMEPTTAAGRTTHLRGEMPPIDLDGIEMRWASQWNESDDGEIRAWRDDVAALIDEVRRLRAVSADYFEEMVRRGDSTLLAAYRVDLAAKVEDAIRRVPMDDPVHGYVRSMVSYRDEVLRAVLAEIEGEPR